MNNKKEVVTPLHIRFKDSAERKRLELLAGEMSLTDFVLGLVFDVKRFVGSGTEYPGWDVVERNRRDRGIKIARDSVPLGMKSPTILYPEDAAYQALQKKV